MEKIKSIQTFGYTGRSGKEYLLIRLEGDGGTVGVGEATLPGRNGEVKELIDSVVAPAVLGRELSCSNYLEKELFPRDRSAVALRHAVSGVEIAAWDALGKSKGVAIYKLLGGKVYPDMKVIMPEGSKDAGAVRKIVEVERYNSDMYSKVYREAESAGCPLVIDIRGRMDARRTEEFLRSVEKLEPLYVTGALPEDDQESWGEISGHSWVPLASRLPSRHDAFPAAVKANMSVLETDILKCGGIGAMKLLATFGETYYHNIAATTEAGAVAAAAAGQVLFSCPNVCGVDYPADDFSDILAGPLCIQPTDAPGIGVEILWEKLI